MASEADNLDQIRRILGIYHPSSSNYKVLAWALAELEEHDAAFDLRWKADMRAIKRWQAEKPDRELIWPDHADLCVWLLEQLEGAIKKLDDHRACTHHKCVGWPAMTLAERIEDLQCQAWAQGNRHGQQLIDKQANG